MAEASGRTERPRSQRDPRRAANRRAHARRSRRRARWALGGRWILLAAAVGALHVAGQGPLATPQPSTVETWATTIAPIDVVFTTVRLVALAAGLYLLAVVTVALVAESTGNHPAREFALRFVPRSARQLLALTTGAAAMSAALALAPVASAAPTLPGGGPTLSRVGAPGALPAEATTTVPAGVPAQGPPPTLRRLASPRAGSASPPTSSAVAPAPPATPPSTTFATTTTPSTASPATTTPSAPATTGPASPATTGPSTTPSAPATTGPASPAAPARPPAPTRTGGSSAIPRPRGATTNVTAPGPVSSIMWVVAPGDSFWSIASSRLATELGHPPSTEQIGSYWCRLIAANRDRLPVPGQPDLLFPGDRLVLPAPTTPAPTAPPSG